MGAACGSWWWLLSALHTLGMSCLAVLSDCSRKRRVWPCSDRTWAPSMAYKQLA
jgi:hypothetical protein